MRNIRYIGSKPSETAFADRTKIVWTPNKVDTVLDDDVATLMLRHPEFEDAGDAKGVSGVADTDVPTPGVGGAGVSDGDKGDVVVSGTGTVWTIDANAVSNTKLADVPTATLKGRSTAGTGDPEDLTAAQARTLLNVANGATANATDAQLRDRSTHTGTQTAATISDFNSAARAQTEAELVAGANVTITPAGSGATRTLTIAATGGGGGGGTVTSVGLSVPTGLSVSGSPVTGSGTMAVTLAAGYVIPQQATLDTFLTEDLATDITTAKTSFSNTDRGILLDAAAGDAPKTFTGAAMRQKPVVALGTSGTVNLDLDVLSGALGTIVATGNITLTTSNSAAGKHGELRIDANGATRTITYPAWNAFGAALVTSITSGQILRIAYECTGTTDSSIDATSALKV